MKVLYLITLAERGGGQVHVADLLHGFHQRFDLALGVGEEGYLTDEARALGIPVHVVPDLVHAIEPARDLRAVGGVLEMIRRHRPSLLHAHTSKAGIVGRVAAKIAGVPSVFTAHTWAFAEGVTRRRRLIGVPSEWAASRMGARVIAVSEANRQAALRYRVVSPDKITVVHNGIPDSVERADPGRAGIPTVIMVARFAAQKDQRLLVEALAALNAPWRLLLVGDGPRRGEVEAVARRLGAGNRVEFLGERTDVSALLAQSSVFALSTNWEGFPLSILEAMRAGLPVVATDVGGNNEAVTHGTTGFLVPHGDREALRGRLDALLRDADLRSRLGAAGRRRFESQFTLEQMLKRTAAVYARAVAPSRRRQVAPIIQPAPRG